MRILSASDAISPAIERTKLLLFKPFRWGRSWKLAATAYLSFAGTIFLPFPLLYLIAVPLLPGPLSRGFEAILGAASVLLTALYVFLFWLCSRLQFAFFDIVLNHGQFVAPAWRKYGDVARPWTLLKCVIGCVSVVLLAACTYPLLHHFVAAAMQMSHSMPPRDPAPQSIPSNPLADPAFAAMMPLMAAFYSAYFGMLFLLGLYYLLLSTATAFMLPSMALEGISPAAAFRRMLAFLKQQTGAFFGFVGLRLVLGIAGYLAVTIAYELVLLALVAVFGLLCWMAYLLLHALHVPSPVLLALGGVALFLMAFVLNGYLLFLTTGTFFTFFEAHTLYFLGGRYPLLGDLLERSTPLPPIPPPPAYGWPAPYPSPPHPTPQG